MISVKISEAIRERTEGRHQSREISGSKTQNKALSVKIIVIEIKANEFNSILGNR